MVQRVEVAQLEHVGAVGGRLDQLGGLGRGDEHDQVRRFLDGLDQRGVRGDVDGLGATGLSGLGDRHDGVEVEVLDAGDHLEEATLLEGGVEGLQMSHESCSFLMENAARIIPARRIVVKAACLP
ncbi:hypothetical protein D3C72_855160 [compost metagenome]